MRSCICEDEKACQEKRLANDSNDCYDGMQVEIEKMHSSLWFKYR